MEKNKNKKELFEQIGKKVILGGSEFDLPKSSKTLEKSQKNDDNSNSNKNCCK